MILVIVTLCVIVFNSSVLFTNRSAVKYRLVCMFTVFCTQYGLG